MRPPAALTDPDDRTKANDADTTAVTLRTTSGKLAQIHTSRRAAYGYDQRFEVLGSKGMLQAGNHRPTEVVAVRAGRRFDRQARALLPAALP
jgi:myo-inositol 2-dehydrogenase/D-chiro-inositol 1-dehydrogenase